MKGGTAALGCAGKLCSCMKRLQMNRYSIAYAMLLMLTSYAMAKRVNPKPVAPVTANGIQYSAEGDGRNQYISATNIAAAKELWRVKVFHTRIKPWIEEDVQWVFVTNLKIIGDSLAVQDERARCYLLSLKTHRVHKAPCTRVFSARCSTAAAKPPRSRSFNARAMPEKLNAVIMRPFQDGS